VNQWLNMLLLVIIDCYFSDRINKKKKKLDIFLFVIWSNMKIWKNSIEKSNIHFVLYSNDQFFIICQIQSSRTSFFIFNLNVYSPHTHIHKYSEIIVSNSFYSSRLCYHLLLHLCHYFDLVFVFYYWSVVLLL